MPAPNSNSLIAPPKSQNPCSLQMANASTRRGQWPIPLLKSQTPLCSLQPPYMKANALLLLIACTICIQYPHIYVSWLDRYATQPLIISLR